MATIRPSFPGGLLFGMPELFLDVALLWRHLGYSRRRKSAQSREHNAPSKLQAVAFPSWSWVAWQTRVDPLSWKCGYDYIKSTRIISWPGSNYDNTLKASSSWKIKLTVRWQVMDTTQTASRPIHDDYKCYLESGEIPDGWSRYSLPFEGPNEADYVHQSDGKTRFRFPTPVASGITQATSASDDDGHLLFCKTNRTYFRVREL